eukprot:768612-Hanusia_phi.AAC.4
MARWRWTAVLLMVGMMGGTGGTGGIEQGSGWHVKKEAVRKSLILMSTLAKSCGRIGQLEGSILADRLRGGGRRKTLTFEAQEQETIQALRGGSEFEDQQDQSGFEDSDSQDPPSAAEKIQIFSKRTELNPQVSESILRSYNWDLLKALKIQCDEGSVSDEKVELPMKLYGPNELRTDWTYIDDLPLTNNLDPTLRSFVEQERAEQERLLLERRSKLGQEYELTCPMEPTMFHSACGVFFDIEANQQDVLVSGLKITCDMEEEHVEYTIYSRNASWFDANFSARQDPSLWDVVMKTKVCHVNENAIKILDDGNLELTSGNFTLLSFDKEVKITKGTKASFYVHGTSQWAVLYRHPITDLHWTMEEICSRYELAPLIDPKHKELTQFMYRSYSSCVPTDADDCITVYAGTMNFEVDHFSIWCSILKRDDLEIITVAVFCGVVCYHKIGEQTSSLPSESH